MDFNTKIDISEFSLNFIAPSGVETEKLNVMKDAGRLLHNK